MIELQRSPLGRVVGGSRLQPLFPTVAAIAVVLLALRAFGQGGRTSAVELSVVLLVFAALTAVGATGWARADAEGVSWRYVLPHRLTWDRSPRSLSSRTPSGSAACGARSTSAQRTAAGG